MADAPKVSIVIPTHNRAALIGRAVRSALAQSERDIEVIVVDDGSRDDSAALLAAIGDPRLRVVRHDSNRGIPAARNSGLAAARGEWLAWLDSDDLARPRRIERQLRFLARNPDIALAGSCAGMIRPDGRRRRAIRVPPFSTAQIEAWLLFRAPFQQSALIGRTAILRAYPYRAENPVCEDLDVFLRVARDHRTANMAEVLVDRLSHPGQITRTDDGAIDARMAELLRPGLERLGMAFDAADLDRHICLARPGRLGREASPAFLGWAEDWLRRLAVANEASRAVDPAALRFAMSFLWLRACLATAKRGGVGAVAGPLARSPLSAGLLAGEGRRWAASALWAAASR